MVMEMIMVTKMEIVMRMTMVIDGKEDGNREDTPMKSYHQ